MEVNTMKYVLLFCGTTDDQARFESLGQEELAAQYALVGAWFAEHGSKIRSTQQLAPPSTATTVRPGPNGERLVTDGPYVEGKEVIGGYALIDVADLDEALRMARQWPAGPVEVRPVMTEEQP
jgi:hypothetical protein